MSVFMTACLYVGAHVLIRMYLYVFHCVCVCVDVHKLSVCFQGFILCKSAVCVCPCVCVCVCVCVK